MIQAPPNPRNSAPPPAARLDDVTKRLGDTTALDGVSLEVAAGEGTAVVGESGSGKSTLLGMLIGLHSPDSGRVDVLGESVAGADLTSLRRRMGYAVQEVALYPHLSVERNILLPAQLANGDAGAARARLEKLLELMALPDSLLHRYPHELSGGQQQRAGLCRAMILEPELLLLDEPFSGLDPLTRSEIHERFELLADEEGTSFVLVTHDLPEAVRLAHRLVILRDGRVVREGESEAVLERPGHPYAEKLIGVQMAGRMNAS